MNTTGSCTRNNAIITQDNRLLVGEDTGAARLQEAMMSAALGAITPENSSKKLKQLANYLGGSGNGTATSNVVRIAVLTIREILEAETLEAAHAYLLHLLQFVRERTKGRLDLCGYCVDLLNKAQKRFVFKIEDRTCFGSERLLALE